MNTKHILTTILLATLLTTSPQNAAQTLDGPIELPLPSVPATLTTPADRADYVIRHFWDAMNFRDTLRCHNRTFMEQNLVNYLSIFPHAHPDALPAAIDTFLQRAVADTPSLHLLNELAEQYLNDYESPMRNEDYYILYLEALLRQPTLTDADRMRSTYQLQEARKNHRGTTAADFSYIDRDEQLRTLHRTATNTTDGQLLLLFYDPTCSHCTETIDTLRHSALLSQHTNEGQITILAVDIEGDRQQWEKTKDTMPQQWIIGIDNSDIVGHALYSLPALPVIYLLDHNKTVLLKNTTTTELQNYLRR